MLNSVGGGGGGGGGGELRKEVLFYVFEQVYFVKFNDLLFSFLHSCLFCL